jgi:hypothetical protein
MKGKIDRKKEGIEGREEEIGLRYCRRRKRDSEGGREKGGRGIVRGFVRRSEVKRNYFK